MGWSLNYLPAKEPELLNEFFLVMGKALYLACAYESKCKYVLRIVRLTDRFEVTNDSSATMLLIETLKDRMLGPTIKEMKNFPIFNINDVVLLENARDARNCIAHEIAEIGPLSSASTERIQKHLDRLRNEIDKLIVGDNLVSRWVYQIDEKEPAPQAIQSAYPKMIEEWLFAQH